ncbi:MAG TPA: sterol desaturase family protein [Polyangiales bacterium]|nr:sterol desaturase family protein [Polyangiales bacterium]
MMMDGSSMAAARSENPASDEVAVVATYTGWFRQLVSVAIFPLTFSVFIGVGIWAMRQGLPPTWLSPLAVPPFILWVAFLERYHPYVRAWNRDHGDFRPDLVHMLVSALLTPQIVTWLLTMALVPLGGMLAAKFDWFVWPRHWPILVQLVLALCISEFGGYWAHRLQHELPLLWRLHAAHHGAARLYWLNATRFHPLDMAMLAGAGFAPLILLGCPPETMAITLMFAGMHGTFQHCNIHVKLGFLNWVFSASELHRWHHSRSIQESSTNYSGHVLLWDIVFGTRFLPKDRLPPCDIGIAGMPTFPNDYIEQLKSPFTLDRLQSQAESAPMVRPLSSTESS